MSKTIAQLRSDVSRKIQGISINKIQGEFEVYNEASREILNDIDFWETKRTQEIQGGVFTGITDYALPNDLKGNKIINLRPVVKDKHNKTTQTYNRSFETQELERSFTIKDKNGIRYLKYNSDKTGYTELHNCQTIDENGTWVGGGDASDLRIDDFNFIRDNYSVKFDTLGVGTVAYLTNDTIETVDLSKNENNTVFVWLYMPNVITNATLIIGEDGSNYWSKTITQPNHNNFTVGWNLLRFDIASAAKLGTPDLAEIKYIKFSITYDGVSASYNLGNIIVPQGTIFEIDYYSKNLFKDITGYKEECDDLNDEIVLDLEGYNCLLYKVLELLAPQIQNSNMSGFDYSLYEKKYLTSKFRYKQKYRSEIIPPTTFYYKKYE